MTKFRLIPLAHAFGLSPLYVPFFFPHRPFSVQFVFVIIIGFSVYCYPHCDGFVIFRGGID